MSTTTLTVIGTVTLTEPVIHRVNSEYAAWWHEYEIPAGDYPVEMAEAGTFYARPVVRAVGRCTAAYTQAHLGGVAVGTQPQNEQHRDVGTERTITIAPFLDDVTFDPAVVEWVEHAYMSEVDQSDPVTRQAGGLRWTYQRRLAVKGDPVPHTSPTRRDQCWRLYGASEYGLDLVTADKEVVIRHATGTMRIESWYTDNPERITLEHSHVGKKFHHEGGGRSLLDLIVQSRRPVGTHPTLEQWAEYGLTADMLDRYRLGWSQ